MEYNQFNFDPQKENKSNLNINACNRLYINIIIKFLKKRKE